MSARVLIIIVASLAATILTTSSAVDSAHALPWDDDMNKQDSLQANEIARAPVKGTVPVGHQPFTMTNEEAATDLKNPTLSDPSSTKLSSTWRGQRLYNTNCFTCHGKLGDGKAPVGPQMSVPDLLTDFYRSSPDGKVFAVIYNGGANMPRYGYKFSQAEIWDIVNYLRFLQGQEVRGMKRPE